MIVVTGPECQRKHFLGELFLWLQKKILSLSPQFLLLCHSKEIIVTSFGGAFRLQNLEQNLEEKKGWMTRQWRKLCWELAFLRSWGRILQRWMELERNMDFKKYCCDICPHYFVEKGRQSILEAHFDYHIVFLCKWTIWVTIL